MLAAQPEPLIRPTASRKRNILQASEGDTGPLPISCKKDSNAPREPLVEFAEGHHLHLSSTNKTGYKGVCYNPGKCPNKPYRVAGPQPEQRSLGYFETAVAAAIAYAKYVDLTPEDFQTNKKEKMEKALQAAEASLVERGVIQEHNGIKLHLSTKNVTGYKGVSYKPTAHPSKPYQAVGPQPEGKHLGYFTSPLCAAEVYARYMLSPSSYETTERRAAEEATIQQVELLKGRGVETEACGVKLHLSATRKSGYLGVRYDKHHPNKPYKAEACYAGKKISLGYHSSAVDAAVAFARYKAEPDIFQQLFSSAHPLEGSEDVAEAPALTAAVAETSADAGVLTMTQMAELHIPLEPVTPSASRERYGSDFADALAAVDAPSPASVRTENTVDVFESAGIGSPARQSSAFPPLHPMGAECCGMDCGMDELEMMIESVVSSGASGDFSEWCDEAYLDRDALVGPYAPPAASSDLATFQTQMPYDGMPYAMPCPIERVASQEEGDGEDTFWL